MFSVVIPTLWKSKYTVNLIQSYLDCDLVSEVILIDNAKNDAPSFDFNHKSKLVHIKQENNIYVNRAWNLGVALAKYENVIISNDDIEFDINSNLNFINQLEDYGAIGCNPYCFNNDIFGIGVRELEDFLLENKHYITKGWGCLLFIKKSKWVSIPEDLLIWFGDDWINKTIEPIQSIYIKGGINTEMSTSSGQIEMNRIIDSDVNTWTIKYNK